MRLLLDEGVPTAVATVFREFGHEVILASEIGLRANPDAVVTTQAEIIEAIVVTWNSSDFTRENPKREHGRRRYKKAGRITFRCTEPLGATRLRQLMPEVEFNYRRSQERHDKRFLLEIRKDRYYVEA